MGLRVTGPLVLFAASVAALPAAPRWANAAEFQSRQGNFVVSANDAAIARQVGEHAEYYRRAKAIEWLGAEMPTWDQPCTVEVRLTYGGAGGATSFAFDQGRILGQSMVLEGSPERILDSVLPHEITHTVFAHKFRRPLPRWADEGGAVLSEDYQELRRHDLMVRQLINGGRMIPLRRLFQLTEYPRDVMALYAQGFSVANFLVSRGNRPYFLDFVAFGQQSGWEAAARQFYGFSSIDHLENEWIEWLRAGRGTGADRPPEAPRELARSGAPAGNPYGRGWRTPANAAGSRDEQWLASSAQAGADPGGYGPARRVVRGQTPDEQARTPAALLTPPAHQASMLSETVSASDAFPEQPLSRVGATARNRPYPGDRADNTPSRSRIAVPPAEPLAPAPPESASAPAEVARRAIPIAVGRTRRSHPADSDAALPALQRSLRVSAE